MEMKYEKQMNETKDVEATEPFYPVCIKPSPRPS